MDRSPTKTPRLFDRTLRPRDSWRQPIYPPWCGLGWMRLHTCPAWPVRLCHAHHKLGALEGDLFNEVEKKLRVLGWSDLAVPLLHPWVIASR